MQKREYYLIPLVDHDIYLNDISLINILKEKYPILAERENKRISILYSVSPLIAMPESVEQKYKVHNIETKIMYQELQVPQYLIAYKIEDCRAKEILTGKEISSRYEAALGIRSVTEEEVKKYYYDTNYEENIKNFFQIEKVLESPFDDLNEVEGYLIGKIGTQEVKGNFKGKIRIKKLS